MSNFFEWLSSGSISALLLLIAFTLVVVFIILTYAVAFFEGREISFWPPKIGKKPENRKRLPQSSNAAQNIYGISIDSPVQDQTCYSGNEDLLVEVSGKYKVKPESGKILRLFTKTRSNYWYQSSIPVFNNNGHWQSEVSLWKGKGSPPYSALIIAVVVDEAGESLVHYAEKVHRETNKNIPFDNLPVYIEICDEVKVKRE